MYKNYLTTKPIIIIGLKRTGTTYLGQVISRIKNINYSYVEYYKPNLKLKKDHSVLHRIIFQSIPDNRSSLTTYVQKKLFTDFNVFCIIRQNIFEAISSLCIAQKRGFFHKDSIYTQKITIDREAFLKNASLYYKWYNWYLDDIIEKIIDPYKIIFYEDLTFAHEYDFVNLGLDIFEQRNDVVCATVKNLPKHENILNYEEIYDLYTNLEFNNIRSKIKIIKGL